MSNELDVNSFYLKNLYISNVLFGSQGIEPTQDWTTFLEIGLEVDRDELYGSYNFQYIELEEKKREYEKKILNKKSFKPFF